ncbi:putative nuclease HARBI1 [Rhagoletis pomonella]|uniref:putative nuclease HARBI1 n=1 Tax=Rhagoletis pomonella TaxID=28610 RepID=UPI00178664D1|nr:putative nuclease HARBI1 [Rhagoletis pomonella]
MSQSSISSSIRKVTNSINKIKFGQYVRFPMTATERHEVIEQWTVSRHCFPGAIGAIDCTHDAIRGPYEHEESYVNHHGYHSINIQMICDPTLKILNVNARYPGARHDSFIWSASATRRVMRSYERGERGVYLIGGSGYPLEPWLMTPLPHEQEGTARYR